MGRKDPRVDISEKHNLGAEQPERVKAMWARLDELIFHLERRRMAKAESDYDALIE